MTVVPSGPESPEFCAMVDAGCRARWLMFDTFDDEMQEDAREVVRVTLVAALRAVTTEPCVGCETVGHRVGEPDEWHTESKSFAAPRVLVDLEVLRKSDGGYMRSTIYTAVRPVEAE